MSSQTLFIVKKIAVKHRLTVMNSLPFHVQTIKKGVVERGKNVYTDLVKFNKWYLILCKLFVVWADGRTKDGQITSLNRFVSSFRYFDIYTCKSTSILDVITKHCYVQKTIMTLLQVVEMLIKSLQWKSSKYKHKYLSVSTKSPFSLTGPL